jgi:hypothetical protein
MKVGNSLKVPPRKLHLTTDVGLYMMGNVDEKSKQFTFLYFPKFVILVAYA